MCKIACLIPRKYCLSFETKENLHLNPSDIAVGTLFTVWWAKKKGVLSYSLIKSKPHLTTKTFLQWLYWHTMINVCITSFNNSPDYSHNHSVYKHCLSFNNVLSWIVGSEATLNTFLLPLPTSKPVFCFRVFLLWFLFCFGELLSLVFSVRHETFPLKSWELRCSTFRILQDPFEMLT